MPYETQTLDGLTRAILDDLRNQLPGADLSVGTELHIRARVTAGLVLEAMWGVAEVEKNFWPDTADAAGLRRLAAIWGLTPKAATVADDGEVTFTGTNGTLIPAGTQVAWVDGSSWTTVADVTIASGEASVGVVADAAGLGGNLAIDSVVAVQAPPTGVDPDAVFSVAAAAGTPAETDAQLQARLLQRIRAGSAGGTASDYEQWALSVAGVGFAYCLPLRRGAGTVSVVVFQTDELGRRIPAIADLRTAVLDYLNTVRPVCADVDVPEVDEVVIDLELSDLVLADGLEWADVEADVEEAWDAFIRSTVPGEATIYRVQAIRAVGAVAGVASFTMVEPAADVTMSITDELVQVPTTGTVSVS